MVREFIGRCKDWPIQVPFGVHTTKRALFYTYGVTATGRRIRLHRIRPV